MEVEVGISSWRADPGHKNEFRAAPYHTSSLKYLLRGRQLR